MTDGIARVRPGDLIRAEDFNLILDRLADLAERVTKLEGTPGTGAPRITGITPAVPRVGDEMRITGSDFGLATGAARVFFDTVVLGTFAAGSSDNLLVFQVPEITGLPDEGRPVVLQVSNRVATVTRTITVLPRLVAPGGRVDLIYDRPLAPRPIGGEEFVLAFRLRSRTGVPLTMDIVATVSDPLMQRGTQIRDSAMKPVRSGQVTVAANREETFFVALQIPARTPAGTRFSVSVRAKAPGLESAVGPLDFEVEAAAPIPDRDIQLNLDGADPPHVLDGTTITLPPGGFAEVVVSAVFERVGTYIIELSKAPGWGVDPSFPPGGFVIETTDLGLDGRARRPFSISLVAPGAGGPPVGLRVTGRKQDGAGSRELTLQLATA
ncbi:IPT/TIG domain-containing protein [Thermopolyspora sp. NPDC052614]|uniref:IPT/TIG domain-containing protein n=1 Tax=Thermopolyspora sp. NPDC052614 TaxID=3155682 RepID=UPI00342134AB